jgi:AraC-like DNA-binding protein
VRRARELIEEYYREPLTLDRVAAAASLSKFHLERAFKAAYGVPMYRYLKRVRIGRALDLLRAGRRPADVASALGLADQSHLSRLMREELGLTPGQVARGTGPSPATNRPSARAHL